MNILVISNNYPSLREPNKGAFVYNLIKEIAKKHDVTVVAPSAIHKLFKKTCSECYGVETWKVMRPKFFSFSNKKIFGIKTMLLTHFFEKQAVMKAVKKLTAPPDIIYAHFLVNSLPVLNYAQENHIPLVVASGESSYEQWELCPDSVKTRAKEIIGHIVCVSDNNKSKLIKLGFDEKKLTVIPNAVDHDMFKPMDKVQCKTKLGIDPNKFVVGFVGHFIERKGPNRLIKAIEKLKHDHDDICLVCVGKGDRLIRNNFTLELPPVEHYKMPEVFNAFDIFVLPTLSEGHCNAIEEAKACGVPVISSKGTSVESQIEVGQGVLVDPKDIDAISSAISRFKNDKRLLDLYEGNLAKSRTGFNIEQRAKRISDLLEKLATK